MQTTWIKEALRVSIARPAPEPRAAGPGRGPATLRQLSQTGPNRRTDSARSGRWEGSAETRFRSLAGSIRGVKAPPRVEPRSRAGVSIAVGALELTPGCALQMLDA